MSTDPHVGVAIIHYRRLDDTRRCLQSLERSRYRSLSVIVVDNGTPDDDSAAIAREFPWAQTIHNAANLGYGAACNQAMRILLLAGAQFVLFLNADTVVQPDAIERLVDAMRERATLGICGPRLLNLDDSPRTQNLGYTYNTWLATGQPIGAGKPASWVPARRPRLSWIMGAALFARRDVLEATGGFDPAFFLYWEDVYFCWEAQCRGYELDVIPEAVVAHRKSLGSEFSAPHVYHMLFGHITFVRRTTHWYQIPSAAAGILAVAMTLCTLSLFKHGAWPLSALYKAVTDALSGRAQRHVEFTPLLRARPAVSRKP